MAMTPPRPSREHSNFGLSDAHTSPDIRRQLDVIGKLGEIGAGIDISLPIIIAVGSQSSGKSSLLEALTGIAYPRGVETCTRCPLESQLRRANGSRKFSVSLKIIFDKDGKPLGLGRTEPFGGVMVDERDVPERIRRAHRAILNPSTDRNVFLTGNEEDFPEREVEFTKNSVLLHVSGADIDDLSLCDLPGLVADHQADVDLVEDLVSEYIKNPASIILLTVPCETDHRNQRAPKLVREYDPDGCRTIGVLTKPDRMGAGTEPGWLDYFLGKAVPLKHGWFCIRRPDFHEMQAGISRDEALEKEEETFSTRAPWNTLGADEKERLGLISLRQYVLKVHGQAISEKLPGYRREVDQKLYETQKELDKLPAPSNHVVEIVSMISAFSLALKVYVEGAPGPKGLVQRLRDPCEVFRKAILDTKPAQQSSVGGDGSKPSPTRSRLRGAPEGPDNSRVIHLDDVMKKMNEFRGRELPNHLPNGVAKEYITDIICKWSAPAEALFCHYCKVLDDGLNGLVGDHFQQYSSLQNRVRAITAHFLKELEAITRERISDLLEMEKLVQTTNEGRYYEACDAYEKDASTSTTSSSSSFSLNTAAKVSLESSTSQSSTNGSSRTTTTTTATTRALQGSVDFGVSIDTKEETVKQARHRNSALNIIASVNAYFDVTHERFTDNIRNAIDFYFVFGLVRNQALEKVLHKELGIGSEDARSRCAEYLKEPPHIAGRREVLTRKRERLSKAKEVFTEAGI